ncbi:MAG: lysophospholipid acyltransferase family protein [Polymorphobacter sp.]
MGGSSFDPAPGLVSRTARAALVAFYHRQGWRAESEGPIPRRCIIIAAPHTSNWDFLYFIGLTHDLGVRAHFMGKKELFRWPLNGLMRENGGIPVDRSRGGNYVQAMIEEFRRRDDFVLTIAPEGTRSAVRKWRTGFYHIAMGAGVPLVCGLMDYARKVGGLGPAMMPSGNYAADMAKVEAYYRSVTPKHPQHAMANIVASSDNNMAAFGGIGEIA